MAFFKRSKKKQKRPSLVAPNAPPNAPPNAMKSPRQPNPSQPQLRPDPLQRNYHSEQHYPPPAYYQSPPPPLPHFYPANPGWTGHPVPIVPPYPAASQPWVPLPDSQQTRLRTRKDTTWKSLTNLAGTLAAPNHSSGPGYADWPQKSLECLSQGVDLCDLIGSKLDSVITLIDGERFSGDERELVIFQTPSMGLRGGGGIGAKAGSRGLNLAASNNFISTNYFKKADCYANSRLPPYLTPLRPNLSTWPLLNLAAQYSHRVYTKPSISERNYHVEADWRMGTKAMVIKSVPNDAMNTIVFAIRGTQTFMDWAVNLNSAPTSPEGFLDDSGNLCHSGFLSVARKMIKPVAARLRYLLEEDPSRTSCSLLITGHSAGGAVASLLYTHMLAENVKSELNFLTGCFKRVHCVTFGSPPVSLLPIQKPQGHRLRKSLFLSFINEGDPVPRADKAYVRSLLDLYTSPPPAALNGNNAIAQPDGQRRLALQPFKKPSASTGQLVTTTNAAVSPFPQVVIWPVPPATLSNAGRLVLLRTYPDSRLPGPRKGKNNIGPSSASEVTEASVQAFNITDAQLRPVVFGDPLMHMMKRYASRIEILATNAVLAKT
ncbi:MAG: hypothetical protein M4579_000042 [Chaenotheca gracillima]|nr:MAG: hypothetical protein M4579_000042 [Chaenotheca gracillima]